MVNVPTNPAANPAVSAYNNGAVAGNTAASGGQNTAPLQGNFALDAVRQVERRDPQFGGNKSTNRQQQPERFQDSYSANADDYEAGSPRGSYLNIVV